MWSRLQSNEPFCSILTQGLLREEIRKVLSEGLATEGTLRFDKGREIENVVSEIKREREEEATRLVVDDSLFALKCSGCKSSRTDGHS